MGCCGEQAPQQHETPENDMKQKNKSGSRNSNNRSDKKKIEEVYLVQEMNQKQPISFCHDVGCPSVEYRPT